MDNTVIVRIWEGLGNQLFQYAYALSLKNKGYNVFLDLNKSFDDSFIKYKHNDSRINSIQNYSLSVPVAGDELISNYNYISRKSIKDWVMFWMATHGMWKYRFFEEKVQHYQERSNSIKPNCYIKGWFQSEDYFKNIASSVRNDIRLRYDIEISEDIKNAINSRRSVSVHIRRGDYVKLHHELNSGYYTKAIQLMKEKMDDPIFIFFSDDIEWVKKNMNNDNDSSKFVDRTFGLKDYEELILMSKCEGHIISNSTFSWWGAWLDANDDKAVIAPRNWLKGQGDIVPKEWTII